MVSQNYLIHFLSRFFRVIQAQVRVIQKMRQKQPAIQKDLTWELDRAREPSSRWRYTRLLRMTLRMTLRESFEGGSMTEEVEPRWSRLSHDEEPAAR